MTPFYPRSALFFRVLTFYSGHRMLFLFEMRAFVVVFPLFGLVYVLLAPCAWALVGETENHLKAAVRRDTDQWLEVEDGSDTNVNSGVIRQDTGTSFTDVEWTNKPTTRRKRHWRKIFPDMLFKVPFSKKCRLPSRFNDMICRAPCICCERFCSCAEVGRAISRRDSRYIPRDLEDCAADRDRCMGVEKWGGKCGSCERSWFYLRDLFKGVSPGGFKSKNQDHRCHCNGT